MRLGEVAGGRLGVVRPSSAGRVWRSEGRASPQWAPRNGPTPDDTLCSRSPEGGEGHFPAGPRSGRGKHGQAAPPGGSCRQRTRRPGEATAPRGSGSAEPGAARLRRRGAGEARGESGVRGAGQPALYSLTRLAGGGRGARSTCCLPRAEHPRRPARPSSSPLSLAAAATPGRRAASGRRRRVSRRPGCAATRGAPAARALRRWLGRSAVATRGAPGLSRRGTELPLAGEARTASSPRRPGPPLSLVPSPRARGPTAGGTRTRRGRPGPGSPPSPSREGGQLWQLPHPSPSPPPSPRGEARRPRSRGVSCRSSPCCRGAAKTRQVPRLPFWGWGLRLKRPFPTGDADEKERLNTAQSDPLEL